MYSESLRARVVGIATVKEDGHDSATLLLPDYTKTQKTHPGYIQSGAWTLLVLETTARHLQSDKRTSFWSR